jgi:phosphate starvation-inducible PhoH-like protein
MVVTGDPSQTDLPPGQRSGLSDALEILPGLKDVSVSNFTAKDVVREDLVAAIVSAYDSRQRRLSESPDNA